MDKRLVRIKQLIIEMAAKINADVQNIGYGDWLSNNHLYIEADGERWITYRIMARGDRGEEHLIKIATNEDELLYSVFNDVTRRMAESFAAEHSPRTQDFRHLFFEKQEELMGILKPTWKDIKHKENREILKTAPFDDNAGIRVDYIKARTASGLSYSQAHDEAVKKYPYPQKTTNN